jgi:hypothetical protein
VGIFWRDGSAKRKCVTDLEIIRSYRPSPPYYTSTYFFYFNTNNLWCRCSKSNVNPILFASLIDDAIRNDYVAGLNTLNEMGNTSNFPISFDFLQFVFLFYFSSTSGDALIDFSKLM